MKEGTSVEKHLKQMKVLTDRLAAIGAPISEEDQVVTLLGSLPPSYATLVTALESRVDDDLSLNFVQQALVHEERKLQRSEHESNSQQHKGDSALLGQKKRFKPRWSTSSLSKRLPKQGRTHKISTQSTSFW